MTVSRLDARDLICPMPVLKARKALKELAVGDVLEIQATDPAAHKDFPAFCEATGHRLLGVEDEGEGIAIFRIEKAV